MLFSPPPPASTSGLFKVVMDVPGLQRHEAPVHSRGHTLEEACGIANDAAVVGAPPPGMESWPHGEWVHAMPLRVAPHTVEDDAIHAAGPPAKSNVVRFPPRRR